MLSRLLLRWIPGSLIAATLVGISAAPAGNAEAASRKTLLYLRKSGEIWGFRVSRTGGLAALPGSPYAVPDPINCGGPCYSLAISEKKHLLFATQLQGLAIYRQSASGSLTLLTPPVTLPTATLSLVVSEMGSKTFLYAFGNGMVFGFEVSTAGRLRPLPGSPLDTGIIAPLTAPTVKGRRLYVASPGTDQILGFNLGSNGAVTPLPGSPYAAGAPFPFGLTLDPKKPVLLAGVREGLAAYRVAADGSLAHLPGSPYAVSSAFLGSGTSIAGRFHFRFRFDSQSAAPQAFLQGSDGRLVPVGTPQTTVAAGEIWKLDPSGKLAFVCFGQTTMPTLASYQVDPTTGQFFGGSSIPVGGRGTADGLVITTR